MLHSRMQQSGREQNMRMFSSASSTHARAASKRNVLVHPSIHPPLLHPEIIQTHPNSLVEVDVVAGVVPLRLHHDLGKLVAPVHLPSREYGLQDEGNCSTGVESEGRASGGGPRALAVGVEVSLGRNRGE